jgi:fatty acid desaturase
VQTATVTTAPGSFKELAARIYDAGLLRRRPGYYACKIALTIAALGAAWWTLFIVGDSWFALVIASLLGVMFTQLGFLGHDAGHQQVFATRRANTVLGMVVGNALIGVSYGWWVPKHSAHHAFPNHVGRDPDLDGRPVPNGQEDNADLASRRRSSMRAAWDRWAFLPLMLLRSTGLHTLGVRRLLKNHDRAAALEALLIAAHAAFFFAIVFWVLSPLKALIFIVVQQGVFSIYLGCSFAPNHKGMPIVQGDAKMSFERRQVITSRNVRGGSLTNFALGGLNYQIEHHLFPSMPRPNLRRAQSAVRSFCVASGLGYREESFCCSMREAVWSSAAPQWS